jgi:hypothetical protein
MIRTLMAPFVMTTVLVLPSLVLNVVQGYIQAGCTELTDNMVVTQDTTFLHSPPRMASVIARTGGRAGVQAEP